MNAIARPYHNDTILEKSSDADKDYFEALGRMRSRKISVDSETVKKIKALDMPEISGNLSRKKFIFF
jgi:hypothetical protein